MFSHRLIPCAWSVAGDFGLMLDIYALRRVDPGPIKLLTYLALRSIKISGGPGGC